MVNQTLVDLLSKIAAGKRRHLPKSPTRLGCCPKAVDCCRSQAPPLNRLDEKYRGQPQSNSQPADPSTRHH